MKCSELLANVIANVIIKHVLREPNYLQCDNFCENHNNCKVVRGSTIKLIKNTLKLEHNEYE